MKIVRFYIARLMIPFMMLSAAHALERGTISVVGNLNPSPGAFYVGISAYGDLVATGIESPALGVDLFSVANPKLPVHLQNWKPTDANCNGNCQTTSIYFDTEAERLDQMYFGEGIQIFNGYGFFASADGDYQGTGLGGSGAYIVDLRNPSDPSTFGKVTAHIIDAGTRLRVHDLLVERINGADYLFMAGLNDPDLSGAALNEVRVYNVTNKSAPTPLPTIPMPTSTTYANTSGWAHAVRTLRRVDGNGREHVYLFCSIIGWAYPKWVGDINADGIPDGNCTTDPKVSDCNVKDRTMIYDVSNPAVPIIQTTAVQTEGAALSGTSENRTHSVALSPDGSQLYETVEPTYGLNYYGPSNNGLIVPPPIPAFLENTLGTVTVYNLVWNTGGVLTSMLPVTPAPAISNPENYGIDSRKTVHWPLVAGRYLFVAWYSEGLQAFDISTSANRTHPKLLGSYDAYEVDPDVGFAADTAGHGLCDCKDGGLNYFRGVEEAHYLRDGKIVVSDSKNGLFILSINQQGKISGGDSHTLAVKQDGSLYAWGLNTNGVFGNGTTSGTPQTTPLRIGVVTDSSWVTISAGVNFSAGVKKDGTLWGWGSNANGQVGIDSTNTGNFTTPQPIVTTSPASANDDWVSVSAGSLHAVAVKRNGDVYAWGYNGEGQVGNGSTGSAVILPTKVNCTDPSCPSDFKILSAAAGANHTMALRREIFDANGFTAPLRLVWGQNVAGQLGDGTYDSPRLSPVAGSYESRWRRLFAGYDHSTGLVSEITGSVVAYAWGNNSVGQLGQGYFGGNAQAPLPVGSFQALATGSNHSLIVQPNGSLWAWGWNIDGQLGNNSTTDAATPVQEAGLSTAWEFPYSGSPSAYSFGLRDNGSVYGWGWNSNGQLALGNTNQALSPQLTQHTPNFLGGTNTTLSGTAIVPLFDNANGPTDWVHWDNATAANSTRKPDVSVRINNWTTIPSGGTVTVGGGPTFRRSRFGGGYTSSTAGVYRQNIANSQGLQFTVPMSAAPESLLVRVGLLRATGSFVVSSSDGTVTNYSNSWTVGATAAYRTYRIKLASLQPGATLTVNWTKTAQSGTPNRVYLLAASLK